MADHHDHNDEYIRGEMDIHQHEHSYRLFTGMTKWGSLHLAVIGVFLVLLTCTPTGLIGSGVVAIVVAGLGWFMLKSKPDQNH